jgi:hypothetical protein
MFVFSVQELVLLHQRGNGVNPGSYQLSPGTWSRYQPISEFTNLDQNTTKNILKMLKKKTYSISFILLQRIASPARPGPAPPLERTTSSHFSL